MFATHIGLDRFEEINIVEQRRDLRVEEARWLLRNGRLRGGSLKELDPLLAVIMGGRVKDEFTYPVVVCDHDERRSVTDGLTVTVGNGGVAHLV